MREGGDREGGREGGDREGGREGGDWEPGSCDISDPPRPPRG